MHDAGFSLGRCLNDADNEKSPIINLLANGKKDTEYSRIGG